MKQTNLCGFTADINRTCSSLYRTPIATKCDGVLLLSSAPPTCVHSILLWAPGERSDAQEAGEVSRRPLDNRRLRLRGGAGMAAPAGWKNSAGRWKRGEMPLAPPSPSLFLPLLLLLETPPLGENTLFPFLYCFM